jgi:hypothetical protein
MPGYLSLPASLRGVFCFLARFALAPAAPAGAPLTEPFSDFLRFGLDVDAAAAAASSSRFVSS